MTHQMLGWATMYDTTRIRPFRMAFFSPVTQTLSPSLFFACDLLVDTVTPLMAHTARRNPVASTAFRDNALMTNGADALIRKIKRFKHFEDEQNNPTKEDAAHRTVQKVAQRAQTYGTIDENMQASLASRTPFVPPASSSRKLPRSDSSSPAWRVLFGPWC